MKAERSAMERKKALRMARDFLSADEFHLARIDWQARHDAALVQCVFDFFDVLVLDNIVTSTRDLDS